MSTGIANLFYLEELSEELLRHGTNYFVQEQVLVDRVQICLRGEASGLNVLTDDLHVLRGVLYILKLQPIDLVHLCRVKLVISGLDTAN